MEELQRQDILEQMPHSSPTPSVPPNALCRHRVENGKVRLWVACDYLISILDLSQRLSNPITRTIFQQPVNSTNSLREYVGDEDVAV